MDSAPSVFRCGVNAGHLTFPVLPFSTLGLNEMTHEALGTGLLKIKCSMHSYFCYY